MIVSSIANSLVKNCIVVNWNPSNAGGVDLSTFQQLTLLNLEMNHAILLVETDSCDDPVIFYMLLKFLKSLEKHTCCW